MTLSRRLAAEFLGTFWLVLGGCGAAVLAAKFPQVGIGLVGVALAFGLTLLTMAFAIGHISGCHINPAVTVGLWAGGRFNGGDVAPYVIVQVLGGIAAAWVLSVIASGNGSDPVAAGLAANGYGEHSPGHYGLPAALLTELVMSFFFLVVILGATDRRAPAGFAAIPIGLVLTLIHLNWIPVTNTSVNAQHRACAHGGWLGAESVVAVLVRPAGRCRGRRGPLPLAGRGQAAACDRQRHGGC